MTLDADRFVVISGCSGGGKSTLLAELARRGYAVVEEPGRRIVRASRVPPKPGTDAESIGRAPLPWIDPAGFARRAIEVAVADRVAAADLQGWVFFDRGLVDAAAALEHVTGEAAIARVAADRYHHRVFLAPPWPEIYEQDAERPHGLAEAISEYERLTRVYPSLGYEVATLPKIDVAERADFVLTVLSCAI